MRVGCVSYCTRQGIALIMRSMYRAGVVTDPILIGHSRPNYWEWYPSDTPQIHVRHVDGPAVDEWIRRIDVALFVETPFDWTLPDRVRAAGKRTAMVPMHEWHPRTPSHKFDLMVCPSRLDLDYFTEYSAGKIGPGAAPGQAFDGCHPFCDKAVYLPVPVEPEIAAAWQLRTRARRWLHSCGNVGYKFHKGTDLVLQAVPLVQHPDFRLTVRAQDEAALRQAMAKARWQGDPRVTVTTTDVPRERLYDDHDVLLAPERFNGLSLPLQEARAAGLLVCTTDRYPANTWLPREVKTGFSEMSFQEHRHDPMVPIPGTVKYWDETVNPLIPVARYDRACISDNYLEFDEAVVEPAAVAARIDELFGLDISDYSTGAVEFNRANSWDILKLMYLKALAGEQ